MRAYGRHKTRSAHPARHRYVRILRHAAAVRAFSSRRSFFLRAEHSSRDARYHLARREANAFRAQPVGESGNHRTLSCRETAQPHASDLLGGFLRAPRVVALPGNLEEFTLR